MWKALNFFYMFAPSFNNSFLRRLQHNFSLLKFHIHGEKVSKKVLIFFVKSTQKHLRNSQKAFIFVGCTILKRAVAQQDLDSSKSLD